MKLAELWLPDAQQALFRAVLDGFARPGTEVAAGGRAGGRAGGEAALALLATVLDESVTLADPQNRLDPDQRRLLRTPPAPPETARFVLLDGRAAPAPDFRPALGTLESPELGATLVLTVHALAGAGAPPPAGSLALRLAGPGVPGERRLHVAGLHPDWLTCRAGWVSAYPLGVDLVLCAADRLVALPRTTRIAQGDASWAT